MVALLLNLNGDLTQPLARELAAKVLEAETDRQAEAGAALDLPAPLCRRLEAADRAFLTR
jgi:hypothetical protein